MNTVLTDSTPDLVRTQPVEIDAIWQAALATGLPAAIWRLPNESVTEVIVSAGRGVMSVPADFDELPMGFALNAFRAIESDSLRFLPADFYWRFGEDGTLEEEMAPSAPATGPVRQFRQMLTTPAPPPSLPEWQVIEASGSEQEQFEERVRRAVEQIERGIMRKVVLSRTKTIQFGQTPDAVTLFRRLCRTYPTAFVSGVYLPEQNQIWLGATPEKLVSQDAQGMFRTVSLAGTQSAFDSEGQQKRPSEAQWTQKEIEEQALVSRYIIECFKRIRLREYIEQGPRTMLAGNLMHLRTDFTVDTGAVNFPQLATVMLRLLHPTSAVCGMPREPALGFIEQHETHDRELYSGYLGPVNVRSETHLFVNLRCVKLEGETGTLFAGAGITEDSVPEREWRETELKCQTFLNTL